MEKKYKIITDQAGVVELANYIKNGNIIAYDSPVDYFHFVGITKNDLARSVRESLM